MSTRTLSGGVFEYFVTDYELISEEQLVYFTLDGRACEIGSTDSTYDSFLSDDKKIFLNVSGSQFHLLYDTMGTIFHLFDHDPETLFILNTGEVKSQDLISNLREFFFKLLDLNNVRYQVYSSDLKDNKVNARNFYRRKDHQQEMYSHKVGESISKYTRVFIKNKQVEPFRKVYLSRRVANSKKDITYGNTLPIVQIPRHFFNRVDDEEMLENFFSSHGFEIVYPENFKTFEEQINFFYEVKTLISLSGAGLSNALFMQTKGNVIELFTSHWIWRNAKDNNRNVRQLREEEHFFYNSIAFEKGHEYVAVNNKEKSATDIINKFETNPILKAIIS